MEAPNPFDAQDPAAGARSSAPRKRKNHRAGKKKKASRRKSFAALADDMPQGDDHDNGTSSSRPTFYGTRDNLSRTSIDSSTLHDHRNQSFFRARRSSNASTSFQHPFQTSQSTSRLKTVYAGDSADEESHNEGDPLLSNSARLRSEPVLHTQYGSADAAKRSIPQSRRDSSMSSNKNIFRPIFPASNDDGYNVNYPPSVPASPTIGAFDGDMRFEDAMLRDELSLGPSTPRVDDDGREESPRTPGGGKLPPSMERRHTFMQAEEDVCFPQDGMSELGDDELRSMRSQRLRSRRRKRAWPDLAILDEWSRAEKEGRSEERRTKKITEPQLVNGRLRPVHKGWMRTEEDAPYRFTYFNEEFPSTIHSQTISELVQPGAGFKELFRPERPVLPEESSESEDSEDDEAPQYDVTTHHRTLDGQNGQSTVPTRQPSLIDTPFSPKSEKISKEGGSRSSQQQSSEATPAHPRSLKSPPPIEEQKPIRYGDRPVWWLDILSPTESEMKIISKAFGIHPLTAEDILLQEAREKVELFRHYYFVNYRTFDQDQNSETYLEPVDMYIIVFREGILTFHFSMAPHAANVRRRIRQLRDYLILSSDWISYAIIDDVTDVYGPLIQNIEDEVDDIDDVILRLHSGEDSLNEKARDSGKSEAGQTNGESGSDMLRRVGDCRKKVMSLYRLLGNKADVIKGFAKRCNEHWEVAPRSEIGLYLGDIQDHIITMTSNLSHYEKILARSHANYLAQINIRMNERQEQTADVLGRLTVLGTIVLPMNIITGLWGMNVWVPGQEYEGDLTWFWWITAGLLFFGFGCYTIAKRVYKIV